MDVGTKERIAMDIAVAQGLQQADLVLKGGQVFNVFTREWETADVAIRGTQIVGIGEYRGKREIDVRGKYVTPGLMDAHVHLESSMLAPRELAKILLLNGVTTVFADPHEIANVLGVEGIEFFLSETEDMPLTVYLNVPSCVPATHLDTSGAELTAADMEAVTALSPRVAGLAEMMNYAGVINGADDVLEKLAAFSDKIIDGHAPGLTGAELEAYIAAGVCNDHECNTVAEAKEKIARGLYVFLREGSAAHNLVDLLPVLDEVDERRCCLCTDDRHVDDLIGQGSINYLLEIGVTQGYEAERLLPLATLNTAECFGIRRLGAIAPGFTADLCVFDDLERFQPVHVLKEGYPVVFRGRLNWESQPVRGEAVATMHMPPLDPVRLRIPAKAGQQIRVISLSQNNLATRELHEPPRLVGDLAVSDTERDILKLAVCERHHETGNVGLGFVQGIQLKRGAIGTTVGHDSHNLTVVGANDGDMAVVANRLRDIGGGIAVAADGEVKASLPLPIAGLMSDRPADVVNAEMKQLLFWVHELGVPDDFNPLMVLSFLSLPVIPELRLTDRGLVDVVHFTHVPLWVDNG
jgi:adenine deaminase